MNTQSINKNDMSKILSVILLFLVMFTSHGYAQSSHVIVTMPYYYIEPDSFFKAKIKIDAGQRLLGAYQFNFQFNPGVVRMDEILGGDSPHFSASPNYSPDSLANGNFTLAAYQSMSLAEPTGMVDVAKFDCHAIGEPGDSTLIDLTAEVVSDVDGRKMLTEVDNLMVRILPDTMGIFYEFPQPGWYFISTPGVLKNPKIAETFPTALGGTAYYWQDGKYRATDALAAQQGYWLAISVAWSGNVKCLPTVRLNTHFSAPGWYMMGSVIRPVDFQYPNVNPPSSILTPVFGYNTADGNYTSSDTLLPNHGYWIAVMQACDLRIREGESGSSSLLSASLAKSELMTNFENEFSSSPPGPPQIDWKTGRLLTVPKEFALHQNYPNPFNPTATIDYDLPKDCQVEIVIYNISGQKVKTLVAGKLNAGYHKVIWNGTNDAGASVATGIYIYMIKAEGFADSKKMILLK